MSMTFMPLQANEDLVRGPWSRLFGRLMQGARESTGRSVEETAQLAGMEAAEWSAVEAGKLLPTTRQQFRSIADALGMEWLDMAKFVLICRGAWSSR